MKISLSIFPVNFLQQSGTLFEKTLARKTITRHNLTDTFSLLQDAGVTGVELFLFNNFTSRDITDLAKIFSGIPIQGIHQPVRVFSQARLPEVKKLFHTAKKLGAKHITFHSDMAGKQLFDKAYIHEVKKLEKKFGIFACFENMQKHHVLWRNSFYWHPEKFQNIMENNNLHITLDTSHLAHSKGDIIAFFIKNKRLIKNIHISDYQPYPFSSSILANYKFHMPLGKGTLPIVKFLKTLKKEEYTGNITMELHGTIDDFCHSAKIIKKYTQ